MQAPNTKRFWTDSTISALRTALIAGGTALVTLDLLPQTEVDKWIGIIMPLVSFGWIIFSNLKAQEETVASIQLGQAMPSVEPAAVITAKLNTGEYKPAKQVENVK